MATYLPLRPGCSFHPFHNGPAVQDYILRTPDNRQFRISASAYEILAELDRGVPLEKIYESIGREKLGASFSEFYEFIVTQYQSFLLCGQEGNVANASSAGRRIRLFLHHTLIPQPVVASISALLIHAYRPLVSLAMIVLIAAAHLALYLGHVPVRGQFHPSLVVLATFFSVVVHEFGHSSAVSRFGGTPGSIGAGLYILLPVLYADVSQVWTFRQKQRVVVDLGGVYFQQIIFAVLAFAAIGTHDPSLRVACISIDLMTLIAINPVFRFDGYWVLVDWLGVPNLHRQAGTWLKQALRSVVRLRWQRPQHTALTQDHLKSAAFVLYALAGNLLLIAVIVLNVRWVQTTITGLLRNAPAMWMQAQTAFFHHQMLRTMDLLTGLTFLMASGLTVVLALWLRGKELVRIGSHSAAEPQPKLTPR